MIRVLLVDDSRDDRALVSRELSRALPDVEAIEVETPAALNQALNAGNFDVVVTDYQLGWGTGLEVLRQVKAQYPHRPVIMFTASGTEEVAVAAMKSGLDDYILKSPKHLVRLPASVEVSLERARTRRRLTALETRLETLLIQLRIGVFRVNLDGQLLEANRAFLDLLGAGSLREAQIALDESHIWPEGVEAEMERLRQAGQPVGQTMLQMQGPDGAGRWVRMTQTAVVDEAGREVLDGILEDISESKAREQQLQEAIRHKEILLQELHHRVRNTFQLMSSMMEIQAQRSENPELHAFLDRTQARVRAMAVIYEKLYAAPDPTNVDLGTYITDLIGDQFATFGVDSRLIRFETSVDPDCRRVTLTKAVPWGLIINELVSNALKHAFPEKRHGVVRIEIREANGYCVLEVSNDGVALPTDFNLKKGSTGLLIIRALARQLGGEFSFTSDGKTAFIIRFPPTGTPA
ncbi:MAG: sensor histidine kinase [Bryobacteraceae bacterium]